MNASQIPEPWTGRRGGKYGSLAVPAQEIGRCYNQNIMLATPRLEMLHVASNQSVCAATYSHLEKGQVVRIGQCQGKRLGADMFSRRLHEIKQDLYIRSGEAKLWPQENVAIAERIRSSCSTVIACESKALTMRPGEP